MTTTPPRRPADRLIIRWRGRTALVAESEFEALVKAGLIPPDAWVVSPTYTRGHAIQADDMEVFHLWKPDDEPPSPPEPSVFSDIYFARPISLTLVLIAANLAVAAALILRWGEAYPYALRHWAGEMKPAVAHLGDLVHLGPPVFVHASPAHLFGNLLYLFVFGAWVERVFGALGMAVIYLVAGYAGAIASYLLLDHPALSVGASGAIFGLIGATFVYLVRHHREFHRRLAWRARRIYIPLVIAVAAYSLTGGNLWAHGGGLVGGALAAWLIDVVFPRRDVFASDR